MAKLDGGAAEKRSRAEQLDPSLSVASNRSTTPCLRAAISRANWHK
jgi:hypothetical protein